MTPDDSPHPENSATESGRLARVISWLRRSPRRALLAGGGIIFGLSLAVGSLWVFDTGSGAGEDLTLEAALNALDEKRYVQAQTIALNLRRDFPGDTEITAGSAFVIGAAAAYETDERWEKDKENSYLLAARHLEESQNLGYPDDRRGEGLYLLGRCLFLSRQYSQCRPYLSEALQASPEQAAEIHGLLTQAYLLDASPDEDLALAHNSEHLKAKGLSENEEHSALLTRTEILLRLSRLADAATTLDRIPDGSSSFAAALLLRGRILMREARPEPEEAPAAAPREPNRDKLDEAVAMFRRAQTESSADLDVTRMSTYLIGVAYAAMSDNEAAQRQFERTRRLFYDTSEGLAASLLSADLLRNQGRHDEAIAVYRRTFAAAGDPRGYTSAWFPLKQFRERMLDAYRFYLDRDDFERAQTLLAGFRPMFSLLRTVELTAQAERAWGRSLLDKAAGTIDEEQRELRRQAYEHFRLCGYTYARLARLRTATPHYTDDIWESAVALAEGQDHFNAIKLLRKYLDVEPHRRRAEALLQLGVSRTIVGSIDEAIAAFDLCLELHPRDASVYDARLWSARARLEKGELEQAEQLLRTNLTGEGLTPASQEWRESLFLLGRLLHEAGRHEEAILKLEEAVNRSPDSPRATHGMYLIAEAYREAAKDPQQKLDDATIESVRLAQAKKLRGLLDGALTYYTRLKKSLLRREDNERLDALESAILRNCYFSEGGVLFNLQRYDEAIQAFSDASTRFQNEPLVLEAFLQIANSHRRLGRVVEARGALAQAKVVLNRLSPELAYTETTNYTYEEWGRLLDQLSRW